MNTNCGQRVIKQCKGKKVKMNDAGWQALFGEISSDAQFMIKFVVMTMGSSLTNLQVMGINSLRCMFSNGFESAWYLLGAIYFAAKQFSLDDDIRRLVNEYYPYVCTCTNDVNNLSQMFGNTNADQQTILSYCSEAASNAITSS